MAKRDYKTVSEWKKAYRDKAKLMNERGYRELQPKEFYRAVFLISLAVSVYFAEPIRAVIPINLLLLLILVHIVYVLIRWYVKGCMRSRGYY